MLTGRELADRVRSRLSLGESTPLGQSSRAVLLENVTAVEAAVLVEAVVDRGAANFCRIFASLNHAFVINHTPLVRAYIITARRMTSAESLT